MEQQVSMEIQKHAAACDETINATAATANSNTAVSASQKELK